MVYYELKATNSHKRGGVVKYIQADDNVNYAEIAIAASNCEVFQPILGPGVLLEINKISEQELHGKTRYPVDILRKGNDKFGSR